MKQPKRHNKANSLVAQPIFRSRVERDKKTNYSRKGKGKFDPRKA